MSETKKRKTHKPEFKGKVGLEAVRRGVRKAAVLRQPAPGEAIKVSYWNQSTYNELKLATDLRAWTMAQTVKLNDDELLKAAKEQKDHFSRSLNGQIEHWARLGRFVEESGIFDLHKVNLAFQGKIPLADLTGEEEHAHARMLWQYLESLGSYDESIARELEKSGGTAYGLNEKGDVKKVKVGGER